MNPELGALLEHISIMGQELSADAVSALNRSLVRLDNPQRLDSSIAATPANRVLVRRLKDLWSGCPYVSGETIGSALWTAQRTSESVADRETVELTWTGPRSSRMLVRRNDQALLEVIAGAEEELLLASYAVNNVASVVRSLGEAATRGVSIRLVLEFHGAYPGDQTYDPLANIGDLPAKTEVFEWPLDRREAFPGAKRMGYLHAKCAVADRHVAFISSANLTTYAMDANLELGVLIRGGEVPSRIVSNFDELIADRTLSRVS